MFFVAFVANVSITCPEGPPETVGPVLKILFLAPYFLDQWSVQISLGSVVGTVLY